MRICSTNYLFLATTCIRHANLPSSSKQWYRKWTTHQRKTRTVRGTYIHGEHTLYYVYIRGILNAHSTGYTVEKTEKIGKCSIRANVSKTYGGYGQIGYGTDSVVLLDVIRYQSRLGHWTNRTDLSCCSLLGGYICRAYHGIRNIASHSSFERVNRFNNSGSVYRSVSRHLLGLFVFFCYCFKQIKSGKIKNTHWRRRHTHTQKNNRVIRIE